MQIRTILGTALLLCTQLSSADTQQSKDALAIYQNSSAEIRIEQFSSQIAKQFSGNVSSTSEGATDTHPQIVKAIEDTYNPSNFQQHILRAINNTLNPREQRKIVQWLNTPLGRKASMAEAVAMMNANRNGISATIKQSRELKSEPKSALVDIVELAAMESALQLDISVFQTSASTFAAHAPKRDSVANDYRFFSTAANSRRQEVASLNQNYSRSLLALAYSDFSKTEVRALISFWGSPTGTRYSVALRTGIQGAFNDANRKFNNDIKRIISGTIQASVG